VRKLSSSNQIISAAGICNHPNLWAAILLLLLFGLNITAQVRVSETNQKRATEGEFITVDGIRLHYLTKGTGRPVVFVHGNPGFLQDYSKVLLIAAREFRVVAFDRPGHGLSQRPPHEPATLEVQARLFHEALAKLKISKPILVGHSWGGTLVLTYALKYPNDISSIVLIAPAAYPEHDGFSFRNLVVHIPVLSSILFKTLRPFIDQEIRHGLERAFAPERVPQEYLELARRLWIRSSEIRATIDDHETRQKALPLISSRYGSIRIPVVIITGDSDLIADPQTNSYPLNRAIGHSKLIILPHTGHEIPQSRPEVVIAAIRQASALADRDEKTTDSGGR
jgi:pimeloyl-ACP methyl ester carboxylesterase